MTLFDVSRQRVQKAAQVDLPDPDGDAHPSRRKQNRLERAAKLLFCAAEEALSQAAWTSATAAPLVLGTTSGGMTRGEEFFRAAISSENNQRQQATRVTYYLAQRQALDLVEAYGMRGPINIIANACAAGANAVGHAFRMVQTGQFDRAIAGGYDALSQLVFAGFDSLQALSPTLCRPFDANRDGLALGEGAAVLTLETIESATKRGAAILGEIAGYGAATDAHHLTQPHPQGDAALITMKAACAEAHVAPAQIGYVNAHGTGTPLNDISETHAINRWAGADVERFV